MPLSLRDYSMPELEALLRDIEAAISTAEAAGRPQPAQGKPVTAIPPPQETAAGAPEPVEPVGAVGLPHADDAEPAPPLKVLGAAVARALPPLEPPAAPVVKYMHPANRNMTWTGEGPQPAWMTAYFAHGGSWSALENTAEKLAPRKR